MKKIKCVLFVSLLTSICFGQTSMKNYLLKNIGYISIPSNMEIQSGSYKKLAQQLQNQASKKFDFEISDNRIVFQQSGLNNGSNSGFASYSRVILETTIGKYGDFEKLTTKLTASPAELSDLNSILKSQVQKSFSGTGLKLITWYGTQIVNVKGRFALKISYLRQLDDHPAVIVTLYQFHNNDRMHQLTLSYRQNDSDIWQSKFVEILSSFSITNIR